MDHYLLYVVDVVIIVNSQLSIHYLCSKHQLLVVMVTREITILSDGHHIGMSIKS